MGNQIRRRVNRDWGRGISVFSNIDLMTKEEIHDFALEVIFGFLKNEEFEILHLNKEYGMNAAYIGQKADKKYAFFIKSDIAPNHPGISLNERNQIIKYCKENLFIPVFCPVSFGATDGIRFEKSIALVGDSYYCNFKGFEYID